MRQKRAKTYRRLVQMYKNVFGFRDPLQVVVDSNIVQIAVSHKIDIVKMLERTLQTKVKVMITQCSILPLYKLGPRHEKEVRLAKSFERRRCNHFGHPKTELDCILECMGPNNSRRYVVASTHPAIRNKLRQIPGVPLIYIERSVMILEPPSDSTNLQKDKYERKKRDLTDEQKLELELLEKSGSTQDNTELSESSLITSNQNVADTKSRRRKTKEPNPLSVKKPKTQSVAHSENKNRSKHLAEARSDSKDATEEADPLESRPHRRRKYSKKA